MTDTTHTAGPWVADAIAENGDIRVNAVGTPIVVASVHNSASAIDVIFGQHPAKQWANARLIAAAPDMLAALRDAALQIEYLHDKFQKTGSGNTVLTIINNAIARATGAAA